MKNERSTKDVKCLISADINLLFVVVILFCFRFCFVLFFFISISSSFIDFSDPMASGSQAVTVHCLPFREYFSASNLKSMLRGFVYEYETPKIVTIHSISSKTKTFLLSFSNEILFSCSDVSFNSIINLNLRHCVSDDSQKRLSSNGHIDYIIDYTQSQSKSNENLTSFFNVKHFFST